MLEELKKDSDKSEGIVLLKSGGVTSETNQGMSFGLFRMPHDVTLRRM